MCECLFAPSRHSFLILSRSRGLGDKFRVVLGPQADYLSLLAVSTRRQMEHQSPTRTLPSERETTVLCSCKIFT